LLTLLLIFSAQARILLLDVLVSDMPEQAVDAVERCAEDDEGHES
jgi:hypothetical protein